MNIIPKPLTSKNFSRYGDVIAISDQAEHFTINEGFTERYHDLAKVDVNNEGGRPLINIFRTTPLPLPLSIKMMERHPLSSQAFIPLSMEPFLVVVAPKGNFDTNAIEAFITSNNQGINYHPGTWHHYCIALNKQSDFIVIDRGANTSQSSHDNCDIVKLDGSIKVELNQPSN